MKCRSVHPVSTRSTEFVSVVERSTTSQRRCPDGEQVGLHGPSNACASDPVARIAPLVATIGPVVRIELERVEALELLGMTLAHLKDAEARAEMSPRVALLMAIRDKLALGLREER
jgi:hypothetical protein